MEHFGCEKNFLEITRNYWKLLEITTDYWKLLVLFRITTTTFAMRHYLMVVKNIVTYNVQNSQHSGKVHVDSDCTVVIAVVH